VVFNVLSISLSVMQSMDWTRRAKEQAFWKTKSYSAHPV